MVKIKYIFTFLKNISILWIFGYHVLIYATNSESRSPQDEKKGTDQEVSLSIEPMFFVFSENQESLLAKKLYIHESCLGNNDIVSHLDSNFFISSTERDEALECAVRERRLETVKLLLELGANPFNYELFEKVVENYDNDTLQVLLDFMKSKDRDVQPILRTLLKKHSELMVLSDSILFLILDYIDFDPKEVRKNIFDLSVQFRMMNLLQFSMERFKDYPETPVHLKYAFLRFLFDVIDPDRLKSENFVKTELLFYEVMNSKKIKISSQEFIRYFFGLHGSDLLASEYDGSDLSDSRVEVFKKLYQDYPEITYPGDFGFVLFTEASKYMGSDSSIAQDLFERKIHLGPLTSPKLRRIAERKDYIDGRRLNEFLLRPDLTDRIVTETLDGDLPLTEEARRWLQILKENLEQKEKGKGVNFERGAVIQGLYSRALKIERMIQNTIKKSKFINDQ